MRDIVSGFRPDVLMHLAAESHVDRSIDGPGEFIQTNVVGTFTLLQAALSYWRTVEGRGARAVPVSSCLDGRSLRLPRRGRLLHRRDVLQPELALFRIQSVVRSSGARLVSHLRFAGRALELLQQLRAVSFPGKAHSARHSECARGQAGAGLRRRIECSRLALCGRSCACASADRRTGPSRRKLQCRRPQRAHQSRGRARDLCARGRVRARSARLARAAHHLCRRSARGTICATRSTRRRSNGISAGRRAKHSRRACARRCSWYLENQGWWQRIRSGVYRGERLGVVA